MKGEVIVVPVEKSAGASDVPAVAKRLEERKSVETEVVESHIMSKMTAAEERRDQVMKEKVEKVTEHVKAVEEKKETVKSHEQERKLAMSQSMKEKLEHAERKAKEVLTAKQSGLSEYMKVLNLSGKASSEVVQ